MYPKRPRTELLTSHISETDALPLPAPSLSPSCRSHLCFWKDACPPPPPKSFTEPRSGETLVSCPGGKQRVLGRQQTHTGCFKASQKGRVRVHAQSTELEGPQSSPASRDGAPCTAPPPPPTHMLTEFLGLRCLLSFPSQLTCRPQGSHHHPPAPPED